MRVAPGTRSSPKTRGLPSVSRSSAVRPRRVEHGAQELGVLPDVRTVGGDVGDGQQLDELADDGLLIGADVALHGASEIGRLRLSL